MNIRATILVCSLSLISLAGKTQTADRSVLNFEFLGIPVIYSTNPFTGLRYSADLAECSIQDFVNKLNSREHQTLINSLLNFRDKEKLDDWLYYQLIRRAAQQLSPKAENYYSYTIYKWFLLTKSG